MHVTALPTAYKHTGVREISKTASFSKEQERLGAMAHACNHTALGALEGGLLKARSSRPV